MSDDPIQGFEPPIPTTPTRRPRRWRFAAIAVVALALAGVVVAFAVRSSDEVTAPPTAPPRSTTPTTLAELPSGRVEIATARPELSTLTVFSSPPPDWDDTEPALITAPTPEPEPSGSSASERDAIPSVRSPVAGRRVSDTGWEFENPGPFEPPQPFTMLVEERRGDWAKVQVPVRPNGTAGWVRVADLDLSTTEYRIEINLTERMLRAYDGNEMITQTQVVVGSPFTPTPTGNFYVTDIVPQTSPTYGPVALATNAYSEIMDKFDTGVPVVALHGTSAPDQVGQARSNGCVRVPNEIIQQLADTVPQGTPVYIFP